MLADLEPLCFGRQMRIGRAIATLMPDAHIFAIAFLPGDEVHHTIARRDDGRAERRIVIDAIMVFAHMQDRMNTPAETIVQPPVRQGLMHEIFGHRGAVFVEIINTATPLVAIEPLAPAVDIKLHIDEFRRVFLAFAEQKIDQVERIIVFSK